MIEQHFQVRFYETDALRHVNNTVIPGWFESAREPIFKWFNPELDVTQWNLILARYDINFLAQIIYGQDVTVKTSIKRIGGSSFEVYQELWQQQQCCANGTTTMVHFDYTVNKSSPIPPDVRNQLAQHLQES